MSGLETRIHVYVNGEHTGEVSSTASPMSFGIYSSLVEGEDGFLEGHDAKSRGLDRFGDELVEETRQSENSHPNIRRLLDLGGEEKIRLTFDYSAHVGDIQDRVAQAVAWKQDGVLDGYRSEVLETFTNLLQHLEDGELRVASYVGNQAEDGNGWVVHPWVKQGIMLGFSLGSLKLITPGEEGYCLDKETFFPRTFTPEQGIRLVPFGATARAGAHLSEGVVMMPPSYANVGAYIGRGSMIDSNALAASCVQIGRHSHISAGAQTGGVLEPAGATPVILGDYVLMGAGTQVLEGARLGEYVTLGAGTVITASTPVIDMERRVAYTRHGTERIDIEAQGKIHVPFLTGVVVDEKDASYGPIVPDGAVVVPGMRLGARGRLVPTPTIVGYAGSLGERKLTTNKLLHE